MVKKKDININQKTLFDIKPSKYFDKDSGILFINEEDFNSDTELPSIDENGFNTEGVDTKNKYKYKNIDKLLNSSDTSTTQKTMIKILYEKGIFDYNEVIEILKNSLQRNIREDLFPYDNNNLSNATIGNALGHYIKFKNINQSKLAQMANIDRTTLFNIVKKPNSVSLINAYKICTILEEDMETLFPFLVDDTEE